VLTRRPAPRPLDIIALEVVLTLATAIQVGLLLWLAVATWDDRGAAGGPIVGILAVVAIAIAVGWFLWLVGVSGWLLAGASGVAGLQVAFLLVLGASGEVIGISLSALLTSLAAAILGLLCGVFLPAPSSRRYRPEPRVRTDAGTGASAPRVSPQVARATDRLAQPGMAGAVAGAVAGVAATAVSAVRRSPKPGIADSPVAAADPEPILQPRPGTPIRTSGPTQPDPGGTALPAPGLSSQVASTVPGPRSTAPRPEPAPAKRPDAMGATPATGTKVSASTPGRGTAATSRPDPGQIARSGRASIDAELAATPAPPAKGTSSGTPGFRLVEPPKPVTRVRPPSSDGPRLSAVDRPPPPSPPRGQPVGRAGDAQVPADPRAVAPTIRSMPPGGPTAPAGPASPAATPRSGTPTDDTLPYAPWDPPGEDR